MNTKRFSLINCNGILNASVLVFLCAFDAVIFDMYQQYRSKEEYLGISHGKQTKQWPKRLRFMEELIML